MSFFSTKTVPELFDATVKLITSLATLITAWTGFLRVATSRVTRADDQSNLLCVNDASTNAPERFARTFQERFERGDYTAIFMCGCCYHFALAIHEEYHYSLEYLPSESHEPVVDCCNLPPAIGHCWALREPGIGIDINGVHPIPVLCEIFKPGFMGKPLPITPEEVRAALILKNYPPDVNDRAFALARRILKGHERFEKARIENMELISDFERTVSNASECPDSLNDECSPL